MRSKLPSIFAAFLCALSLTFLGLRGQSAPGADPLDGAVLQVQSNGKTTRYHLAAEPDETKPESQNEPTTLPSTSAPTTLAASPSTAPAARGAPSRMSVTVGQMAPCAVFVDATGVRLATGSVLTARFEWDFGDAGSPYNTLVGWNAAHVYDKPGNYTITLRVTDGAGAVTTITTPVEVKPDKRHRIYISSSIGNDRNPGLAPDQPVRSVARVHKLVEEGTEVLFRAGDTFVFPSAITISAPNIVLGAYDLDSNKGGADRPRLVFPPAKSGFMIQMTPGKASEIVVQDLALASASDPNDPEIISGGLRLAGSNLVVRRCEFQSVNTAINGSAKCSYVLVQDNISPTATSLRANFLWAEGSDYVVLGNHVANSTREHCLRFGDTGTDRVLIAYNELTNLDRRAVDPKDYNKKTIVLQNGTLAFVTHNKLTDGILDISTAMTKNSGAGVANRGAQARFHWVVVDANTIKNARINVTPNGSHVMIRNNVISAEDVVINVAGHDEFDADRFASDVTIVNNTGTTTKSLGSFVLAGDGAAGIVVANNLYLKAEGTPKPLAIHNGPGDGAYVRVTNNVWPARTKPLPPGSTDDLLEDPMLDAGFVYPPSCKAATAGKPFPGVFIDLYDNPRTGDRWAAGATNSSDMAKITPVPSLISP